MKIQLAGQPAAKLGLALLAGLLIGLPASAAKGYHLWYDEDGQAVYSQFPPGDNRPTETVKPPPPPAEEPEVARQRLQQQLQRLEDNREDRTLAEEKAGEQQAKAAQSKQRCETARRNLKGLDGRPRQLYKKPDGTVVRMDEDERQRRRAEAEKIVAESCR